MKRKKELYREKATEEETSPIGEARVHGSDRGLVTKRNKKAKSTENDGQKNEQRTGMYLCDETPLIDEWKESYPTVSCFSFSFLLVCHSIGLFPCAVGAVCQRREAVNDR